MEYLAEAGELFLDSGTVTISTTDSLTLTESTNNPETINFEKILPEPASSSWWRPFWSQTPTQANTSEKSATHHFLARPITKIFEDGSSFSGYVDSITGKFVYGTLIQNLSGEIYEGPFRNGKRHGDGATCTRCDGVKFVGKYRNDYPFEGTLISKDFTYSGKLYPYNKQIHPVFHGDGGCLMKQNGYGYRGEFRMGLYHGCGLHRGKDWDYKGEFCKGKRHGMGTFTIRIHFPDDFLLPASNYEKIDDSEMTVAGGGKWIYTYTGMWDKDVKEGQGKESLAKYSEEGCWESCFEGHFHQNQRNGPGELITFSGEVFEGVWRFGRPSVNSRKHWRIAFSNKDDFNGEVFELGQEEYIERNADEGTDEYSYESIWRRWTQEEPKITPHGLGSWFYADTHDLYTGNFHMGKRNGCGVYIMQETGDIYDGMWTEDEPLEASFLFRLDLYKPIVPQKEYSTLSFYYPATSREVDNKDEDLPIISLEDTIALKLRTYLDSHDDIEEDWTWKDLANNPDQLSSRISRSSSPPVLPYMNPGKFGDRTLSTASLSCSSSSFDSKIDVPSEDDLIEFDWFEPSTDGNNNPVNIKGLESTDMLKNGVFTMFTKLEDS